MRLTRKRVRLCPRSASQHSRVRPLWAAFASAAICWAGPRVARGHDPAAPPREFCAHCELLVGAGSTYNFWHGTDGIVLPLTLEIDDSRWELGAFRFATRQYLKEVPKFRPSTIAAKPYWGFSAMRRWQILHRSPTRLYLGIGANYRTETDLLIGSKWNFSLLVAIRFDVGKDSILELAVRHWSNAWLKFPDRGENFVTFSVGL